MEKTEAKRQIVIEKVADHLLASGLKNASLRQLATAVGMSDRMLLHYFATKEELLTAALNLITVRMVAILESARSDPMPFGALLPHLVGMMQDPYIRPYLRLFLELVALAANDEETYGTLSRHIYDDFLRWTALALQVEREEEREALASLAMVTVEGFVLLDALNYTSQITKALEGIALQ